MQTIKLKADREFGEGSIKISHSFKKHNSLLQADLLQDWIALLQDEYADVVNPETFLKDLPRRAE